MVTEHQETLNILINAIQIEIDGKDFHLKASHSSGNQPGKKLLSSLDGG